MNAKGLYRTKTPASGAEYAFVDYGVASGVGEITRSDYEARGYPLPFEDLPTEEECNAKLKASAGKTAIPQSGKKRPLDPAQLAKFVVDVATGAIEESTPEKAEKHPKKLERSKPRRRRP